MKKVLDFLKSNYRIFVIYVVLIIVLFIPLPYYIYAPGGIVNIKNRVIIEDKYTFKGSFNLSYVTEYKGNIMTILIGLVNKNWDIIKKEKIIIDNETMKDYNTRDKLLLKESYNNATIVAYKKAKKKINVINSKIFIGYMFKESKTDLKIGDQIISIDGIKVKDLKQLNEIINKYHKGDKVSVMILRNNKEKEVSAKLIDYKKRVIIGVGIVELNDLTTNPNIRLKYVKDEYGSSGGLMLALSIYNSLIKKDITKGKTIVGTGTIDRNGNVGEIDGIKYKMKGAAKKKIDLFIVPKENFQEAKKLKKKYNYKFKVIGVSSFDETINYLNKI